MFGEGVAHRAVIVADPSDVAATTSDTVIAAIDGGDTGAVAMARRTQLARHRIIAALAALASLRATLHQRRPAQAATERFARAADLRSTGIIGRTTTGPIAQEPTRLGSGSRNIRRPSFRYLGIRRPGVHRLEG
ncbi:hypothetical protein GCM10009539_69670 [Cryptosporangium japonicum]|uniref:Uncharacterized protein n=1 Tax=Cryptosporangium japonicum TaxID=80872 RepID=A0ABN0V309_9ACTN